VAQAVRSEWRNWVLTALVAFTGFFPADAAAPQERQESIVQFGARVNVTAEGHENVSAAGARVSILGNALEDVWVAGGEVELDISAQGDLWAAGGRVDMRGSIGQDAWIAGASIEIDGTVGQDLNAAGATVIVDEEASVGGETHIVGAFVDFRGRADGELTITADELVVSGSVSGPVTLQGRLVRIGDRARIAGDVTVRMVGSPSVAPGAQIGGRLTVGLPQPPLSPGRDWSLYGMISLAFAASAFMIGAMVMFLAPLLLVTAMGTVGNRPGLAFVNGLVAAIGGPLIAIVLIVIVVTAPLGVFLLLALPLLALTGYGIIAAVIGGRLLPVAGDKRRTVRRLIGLAIGIVLVAAVGLLPYVGIPVLLALVVLGVGAMLLALAEHLFGFAAKRVT